MITAKTCAHCGKQFTPSQNRTYRRSFVFCSRSCHVAQQRKSAADTLMDRFWANVKQTPECWLWTGSVESNPYGNMRVGSKNMRANRAAYTLLIGPIPDEMLVRHTCDNPQCVNPAHLLLGTHADNVADRHMRQRDDHGPKPNPAYGERIKSAKLKAEDVKQIKYLHSMGMGTVALGIKFLVHHSTITDIIRGRSWKRVL